MTKASSTCDLIESWKDKSSWCTSCWCWLVRRRSWNVQRILYASDGVVRIDYMLEPSRNYRCLGRVVLRGRCEPRGNSEASLVIIEPARPAGQVPRACLLFQHLLFQQLHWILWTRWLACFAWWTTLLLFIYSGTLFFFPSLHFNSSINLISFSQLHYSRDLIILEFILWTKNLRK
jgi:hypothetical protein